MSFENLPDDWPTRRLDDEPLARDVLDLVVRDRDRRGNAVALLLCGRDGRLQQPVVVSGVTPTEDLERDLEVLRATVLHPADPSEPGEPATLAPSVVLAIVRPQGGVDDADRAWHQRALTLCREAGVDLLGTHLVTRLGVETLPGPVAGRSAA